MCNETKDTYQPVIYGYLRVSSDEQDVNNQKTGVVAFAEHHQWEINKFITDEGVSGGVDPSKRKLGPMLKKLKKGDIIIASEISRLGRDLYMVMEILHHCMKVGCLVYTVKDNFVLGDNIQSKVLAFAFGLAAEIERQMIRQRTAEAIKRKRAMGILMGRPPGAKNNPTKYKLYGKRDLIVELIKEGVSKRQIAKILKVDRNTLDRFCSHNDIRNNDGEPIGYYFKAPDGRTYKKNQIRGGEAMLVDLPKDEVKAMILADMTIVEIAAKLPQFSYDEVYDSISYDIELHALYRQHAHKKLTAMSRKNQKQKENA